MKAAVYERYGSPDVVSLVERPDPKPRANEVRIRTVATTVTTGDWRMRSLQLPGGFGPLGRIAFGVMKPRQSVLGTELSGIVEAVGAKVRRFQVGDAVVAVTGMKLGCHAEFVCIPENGLVIPKPQNLTFEQAAAMCFGGLTAWSFLQRAKLQVGERVLVTGASGAVGSAAVQLAKHLGAHVTGICSSPNVGFVRELGADEVIDYKTQDFAQLGRKWDVIFDSVGLAPSSVGDPLLAEGGRLLLILAPLGELIKAPITSLRKAKKVIAGPAPEKLEDVQALATLAASREYEPIIDSVFDFADIREAHRRVDTGHKRGNVVVRVSRA